MPTKESRKLYAMLVPKLKKKKYAEFVEEKFFVFFKNL
jgi:hypothetical protein